MQKSKTCSIQGSIHPDRNPSSSEGSKSDTTSESEKRKARSRANFSPGQACDVYTPQLSLLPMTSWREGEAMTSWEARKERAVPQRATVALVDVDGL